MDRSELNALMERASAGDAGAFGALAAEVQDELFRLALAQGLPRDDAAEATQEALLRAYTRRSSWRHDSDALAWLCGFVMNVARECHRRQRLRKATFPNAREGNLWDTTGAAKAAGPPGLEPDQVQRLKEASAELPPRQREAIACRYLRRMSIGATAQAMGCAEGTVKSAVSAALERLRAILEHADDPSRSA